MDPPADGWPGKGGGKGQKEEKETNAYIIATSFRFKACLDLLEVAQCFLTVLTLNDPSL